MFDAAKAVAQPFVSSHGSTLTLQIKKDLAVGKVLLDIYRNRPSQTIVAAYSVRGLPGAPVSTPLHWEELEVRYNPEHFNLRTVPQRISSSGDPWEAIAGYATEFIPTGKWPITSRKNCKPARTYKTPEQLESYSRNAASTKRPSRRPHE